MNKVKKIDEVEARMNPQEKERYYHKLKEGLRCRCGITFYSHHDVHEHLTDEDASHPLYHFDFHELNKFFKRLEVKWEKKNKLFNPSERDSEIEWNR